MNESELFEKLSREYGSEFSGWDFSHLSDTGRMESFPLPWNYRIEIQGYIDAASCLLDMGTGGGEFLSSLRGLPPRSYATEGYEPNLPIAAERLGKRGIEVRKIENDKIPFEDGFFDVILNRHESYDVSELARVLRDGGYFITQQVGGLNAVDLNMWLGAKASEYVSWSLSSAVAGLESAGFEIIVKKECITKTRFYDVGAIIYYLKCIPWQVEGFSLEKYRDGIMRMAGVMEEEGYMDFLCHRFLIAGKNKRNI